MLETVVTKTTITKKQGEYQVKAYNALGQRISNADYFTDDKADAQQTARNMVHSVGKELSQLATDYLDTLNTDKLTERNAIIDKVLRLSAKDAVYFATCVACDSRYQGTDGYKCLASLNNRL